MTVSSTILPSRRGRGDAARRGGGDMASSLIIFLAEGKII